MNKKIFSIVVLTALLAVVGSVPLFGQAALPSTTLSAQLSGGKASNGGVSGAPNAAPTCFQVASTGSGSTAMTAPTQGSQNGTVLLIDNEEILLYSVNSTTGFVCGTRGWNGTPAQGHASGATVNYIPTPGPANVGTFGSQLFGGLCVNNAFAYTPVYVAPHFQGGVGLFYNCFSATGTWEKFDPVPSYQANFTAGNSTGTTAPFIFTDTATNAGTGPIVQFTTTTGSAAGSAASSGVVLINPSAQAAGGTPSAGNPAVTIAGEAGGATNSGTTTAGAGGVGIAATGGAGGAGNSTGTGGAGGANTITGGVGGASVSTGTSGAGGAVTITGGASGGTASGGTVGTGGAVSLVGGAASTTAGTAGVGGAANVTGGAGSPDTGSAGTGGAGGAAVITGGSGGVASTGAATGGAGGAATLAGGAGAGTITGGAGGAANVTAGAGANGSTAGGAGGNVVVTAGNAGTGGTPAGGQIQLVPGIPTSTGATGFVLIAGGAAGAHFNSTQTTKPAAGGTCTTPAVANGSTDFAGQVSSASCTASQTMTATFNKPYGTAPFCVCNPANAAAAVTTSGAATEFCSASTTALTVTSPAASSTAGAWNYVCTGSN